MIRIETYVDQFGSEPKGTIVTQADLPKIAAGQQAVIESYVDGELAKLSFSHFDGPYDATADVPTPYAENTVYLVGAAAPYLMYAWIDTSGNTLQKIGELSVDLTDYYIKSEVDGKVAALQTQVNADMAKKLDKKSTVSLGGAVDYETDGHPYLQRGNKSNGDTTRIDVNGDGAVIAHWSGATRNTEIIFGTNYDKGVFANENFGRKGDNDFIQGKQVKEMIAEYVDASWVEL